MPVIDVEDRSLPARIGDGLLAFGMWLLAALVAGVVVFAGMAVYWYGAELLRWVLG